MASPKQMVPQPLALSIPPPSSCPCAPRPSPAADPFDLEELDLLDFALPPAMDEETKVESGLFRPSDLGLPDFGSEELDTPVDAVCPDSEDFALPFKALATGDGVASFRAAPPAPPRLRPAADPVDLWSLPPMTLPPLAEEGGCDLHLCDARDDVQMAAPPAPRLRPAVDPVSADELPPLFLPPLASVSDELEERSEEADSDEEARVNFAATFGAYMAALDDDDDDNDSSASVSFELRLVTMDACSDDSQGEEPLTSAPKWRLEDFGSPATPPSPSVSLSSTPPACGWKRMSSSCSTEASTPRQALRAKRGQAMW